MPAETLGKGFEVPMRFRMDCALAPLREVVPMAFFFADDVEVLRLTVHCVINASGFCHTEHSCHCHNARKLQRIMNLMMMMTSTQRVALMAHLAHYQIYQRLAKDFVLCAFR